MQLTSKLTKAQGVDLLDAYFYDKPIDRNLWYKPMQDLIDRINIKRRTHYVDLYTCDDNDFYIRWVKGRPTSGFYPDCHLSLIQELEVLARRGYQVCPVYNAGSTRGVFAPGVAVITNCKDCKGTGYYQPFIGPREPCQTCN